MRAATCASALAASARAGRAATCAPALAAAACAGRARRAATRSGRPTRPHLELRIHTARRHQGDQ